MAELLSDSPELSTFQSFGGAVFYNGHSLGDNSLRVHRSVFASNAATTGGALMLYGKDVHILECVFVENEATLGAVRIDGVSNVTISSSRFTSNRGHSVMLDVSSNVRVWNCSITHAAGVHGAAISATDSTDVSLVESVFGHNTATGGLGGALYLLNVQGVEVESCEFIGNSAQQSGAAMHIDSCYGVDIHHNSIDGNVVLSQSGGGLFFAASINVSVSLNSVVNNSAAQGGGGGLFWLPSSGMTEPGGLGTNVFIGNSALYGDDYATDAVTLVYTPSGHHERRSLQSSTELNQVTLETFDEPTDYIVDLHDTYGTVVKNQDTFLSVSVDDSYSFSCGDEAASVSGKTVTQSDSGNAAFDFATHCNPGGDVRVVVTPSVDTVAELALHLQFRGCIPGEYYSAGACHECEEGSYSLDSNADLLITSCWACPDRATCQGSAISVEAGHWRLSDNTSVVFECPIAEACLGK